MPVLDASLFLPEPEPRPVHYTVISVDDHVVEPPRLFEGRLPNRLRDGAPRIVETPEGHQAWEFDGQRYTQMGMNAVVGRRPETVKVEPFRFDQMRPGCYDVDARVRDMDINGVWGSMNSPSQITGFCGRVYSGCSDPELGLATTKAWNDWLFEEWYSAHPDRIIPLGITFLSDPAHGAAEIRRNAKRGFRSVTMPERPHRIGLPPVFDTYWDPIIEACADTGTVISLHIGSCGQYERPPARLGLQLGATMNPALSLSACAEWLWSEYPVRFPTLEISMAEGGIGWVAMLMDRLDDLVDRSGYATPEYGMDWDLRPSEVLQRNFRFCTIDDPSTIDTRDRIGLHNIMTEVDYPHGDSTWPDTQATTARTLGHLTPREQRAICCENAARVFRHPLPETVLP